VLTDGRVTAAGRSNLRKRKDENMKLLLGLLGLIFGFVILTLGLVFGLVGAVLGIVLGILGVVFAILGGLLDLIF